MFEVSVEQTFAAGHALRNYKGKCENVHGHNYRIRVTVEGDHLDETGLLVDFGDLKRELRATIERLDHQFINDVPPFDVRNPSAENIAFYFYEQLGPSLTKGARITEIKVWETDTSAAAYRPKAAT